MRTGIMLCSVFDKKYYKTWDIPCFVQPKIEGDRCRAIIENTSNGINVSLVSSQGNPRTSVPHIVEQLTKALDGKAPRDSTLELDGELYCHGMRHQDIRSIVSRTTNLHPNYKAISFHIFDICQDGVSQLVRTKLLEYFIQPTIEGYPNLKIVETNTALPSELDDYYSKYISNGYEGIILRNPHGVYIRRRTTNLLKIKAKKDISCEIVGVYEEIDKNGYAKGSLGSVLCIMPGGSRFAVGTGKLLTRSYRLDNWPGDHLLGRTAHIKYQELTARGVPYFPSLYEITK